MKGKITQWKDDRGFGFIASEDGGEKLFFHISVVKTRGRRPQVGDVVLYEAIRDSQGRPNAESVVIEGVASEDRTLENNRIHTGPPKKDALDYVSIVLVFLSLAGAAYSFFYTGTIENLIPFGVVFIVGIFLLNRQKKPAERRFPCTRCRRISEHDKRTIMAWNKGFSKLYCKACHQKWLAQQPNQTQYVAASGRGRGCLGLLALLFILPTIAGVGVYQWL